MERAPVLSVAVLTRDRVAELEAVLGSVASQDLASFEVHIGDNGSCAEMLDQVRGICARFDRVTLHEFGANLGVSSGRNRLLARCNGTFVVEIDDDAVFAGPGAFSKVISTFEREPRVGIIAFKITNFNTGRPDRSEYPFLNKSRDVDLRGDSAWFIGCGHAFRRDVLNQVGLYRDFTPYGAEEFDYAFRALDAGWRILYEPAIEVLHRKSQVHRIVDPLEWGTLNLKQRMKAALLNLPFPMWLSYLVVRGGRYSKGFRHPSIVWRALRGLWGEREYIRTHRSCIRYDTVKRLIRLKGPLFF